MPWIGHDQVGRREGDARTFPPRGGGSGDIYVFLFELVVRRFFGVTAELHAQRREDFFCEGGAPGASEVSRTERRTMLPPIFPRAIMPNCMGLLLSLDS